MTRNRNILAMAIALAAIAATSQAQATERYPNAAEAILQSQDRETSGLPRVDPWIAVDRDPFPMEFGSPELN